MKRRYIAMQLIGVGFVVILPIVGGVALGVWLDEKLDTRPILIIIGLFLGLATAAVGVYKMLEPLLNKQNKDD